MLRANTLLIAVLLATAVQAAGLPPSAPPTSALVEYYTRPMVRARLRLPDSLAGYTVARIDPVAGEPGRWEVEVRFSARAPFGGVTAHQAVFRMRRAAEADAWIVTAQ